MKRAISIMLAALAAQAAFLSPASGAPGKPPAEPPEKGPATYTIVLAGGSAENMMHIWLSPDGRSYVIDSVVPLEVGGTVCENPPGNSNELLCQAPLVAGFEVNAGRGDDVVGVSRAVEIPVTLRGGAGDDALFGGSGDDLIIGGNGDDRLAGRGGDDLIYGGPGDDVVRGGPGDDTVRGGIGRDVVRGGGGHDNVRQSLRHRG